MSVLARVAEPVSLTICAEPSQGLELYLEAAWVQRSSLESSALLPLVNVLPTYWSHASIPALIHCPLATPNQFEDSNPKLLHGELLS